MPSFTPDKFLNFVDNYDKNNSKHKAAFLELAGKITPSLLSDEANWVRVYRTQPAKAQTSTLSVPFFPQTDNYTDADRTCNSSACAMCLEYFRPGTLKGAQGDDAYIKKVFAIGDTTDHDVQTKVLSSYGVSSHFSYGLSFNDLNAEISAQRPVVIGILHRGSLSAPTGGHMIVVTGITTSGDYVVNDPYGSLNDGYTSDVYNGKGAIYTKKVLESRWCANGNDGWGRIFEAKRG